MDNYRIVRKLGSAVLSFSLIHSAAAGTVVCEGTVEDLKFHQPGLVGLRLSSMNASMWVCSMNENFTPPGASTITPSACKAMYASLLAAKLSNSTLTGVYFDGDQVPTSCNTVQIGSSVYLRHFEF